MRADGQTDMTKLIVAFRYFSRAPKDENFARETWVRTVHFAKESCFCICTRVSHSVDSVRVKVSIFYCLELKCNKYCAGPFGLTGRPHFLAINPHLKLIIVRCPNSEWDIFDCIYCICTLLNQFTCMPTFFVKVFVLQLTIVKQSRYRRGVAQRVPGS
jgi:hypothetical protein